MTDCGTVSEKLHAGTISGAYGIQGWVRVHALTDPLENFLTFPAWFVRRTAKGDRRRGEHAFDQLKLEDGRRHGKGLIVKIEGVDDRTAAEKLRGTEVWVDAEALAPLADGEFYWHQLEGLEVWSCAGHRDDDDDDSGPRGAAGDRGESADRSAPVLLGVVDHLLETGANDVLVLAPCEGSIDQCERLIPYLPDDVVQGVDLKAGRIDVSWHPDD